MDPKNQPSGGGGPIEDKVQEDELHVKEPHTLILPDENKFTTYLFSTFQRTTGAVFLFLIVLSIPITIVLLSRPQDIRQRAGFEATPAPSPQKFNVSGTVFVDTNGNKSRDSWENGPEGVRVKITGGMLTIDIATDKFGGYSFERYGGFLAGPYSVTIQVPQGYTSATNSKVDINLGPSAIVDFGIIKK